MLPAFLRVRKKEQSDQAEGEQLGVVGFWEGAEGDDVRNCAHANVIGIRRGYRIFDAPAFAGDISKVELDALDRVMKRTAGGNGSGDADAVDSWNGLVRIRSSACKERSFPWMRCRADFKP